MADPANDFIRDYQTLAQHSWDTWTRQLQQPSPAASPFFAAAPAVSSGNDALDRTLAGLKGYFDWMQGVAATGAVPQPATDWRQQLQHMFGGAGQPFAQAFNGIDSKGAEGFARQWQSWLQAAQQGGLGDTPGTRGPIPAFGQDREQQMEQQAMSAAMLASLQATARYQALIQRASAQGMQRMQDKLAERAEPGRQVDSLKALYDLWVDSAEEAYAEIALTEEFRAAYGDMVDAQMRVRQLQQRQTEQMCQQLGVPTRSEVSSLGERLQALRREFRAGQGTSGERGDELAILRREVAALKRQLAGGRAAASTTTAAVTAQKPARKATPKRAVPKKAAAKKIAVKKVASRQVATKKVAVKKTAVKKTATGTSKSVAASRARTSPRKRKQGS